MINLKSNVGWDTLGVSSDNVGVSSVENNCKFLTFHS